MRWQPFFLVLLVSCSSGGHHPDAASTDAANDRAHCGQQTIRLERLPPELLLVLDRSGSMTTKVPGTDSTRWVEVTAALEEVLARTAGSLSWGLQLFPSAGACGVANMPEVPITVSPGPVADAIRRTMPNSDQSGTPTAIAIENATSYLQAVPTRNLKYIVLATDGAPTCGGNVLDVLAAAKDLGFRTFVIGIAIAGTAGERTLNSMAVAGGEPRDGETRYYPVSVKEDLVAALGQIASRLSNCTFPLARTPPSPDEVAVFVQGNRLQRDATQMDGWNYGGAYKSVQIFGPACDELKAGSATSVEIVFGCAGGVIP